MTIPPLIVPKPDGMSPPARAYLVTAAFHFALVGITIIFWPEMYGSAAFLTIVTYTHLLGWGLSFMATAIVCLAAAITRRPNLARAGMIMAFVVCVVTAFAVGWGVIVSWIAWREGTGPPTAPVFAITIASLGVKDLLMVRYPLRVPLFQVAEPRRPEAS